jgi:hypothetical protein
MNETSSASLGQCRENTSAYVKASQENIQALDTTRESFRINNAAAVSNLIDNVESQCLKTDTFTGESPKRQEYVYALNVER